MKPIPCKKPMKRRRNYFNRDRSINTIMFIIGVIIGLLICTFFENTKVGADYEYVNKESLVEVKSISLVEDNSKDYLNFKSAPVEKEVVDTKPKVDNIIKPCSTKSTFKSYMDYRKITNKSSSQYKLQKKASTLDGYRIVDDRYMVAMANFKVGDKLDIELSSGEILKVIVGDIKAKTNCTHKDGSMLEFIVDTNTMDSKVKRLGNFNSVHKGTLVKIMKIK